MQKISIIIPALNEATGIAETLRRLQPLRQWGHEVILSDGGSLDETGAVAAPFVDQVVRGERGRAKQMNAGAAVASGEIFWFLHADTYVPQNADVLIRDALQQSQWGRFNVRLSGNRWMLRVVEWMMNQRSCWSSIATGDQGMFMPRDLFFEVGGFPEIPLMEDIAISERLRERGHCACVKRSVITSSRRWEQNGVVETILLMWRLRFSYWQGVPPEQLAKLYR